VEAHEPISQVTYFSDVASRAHSEIRLQGAGGDPVDFARTIVSHGVAELPPNRVDLPRRTLETTLPVA
jgi:hypothetical protein